MHSTIFLTQTAAETLPQGHSLMEVLGREGKETCKWQLCLHNSTKGRNDRAFCQRQKSVEWIIEVSIKVVFHWKFLNVLKQFCKQVSNLLSVGHQTLVRHTVDNLLWIFRASSKTKISIFYFAEMMIFFLHKFWNGGHSLTTTLKNDDGGVCELARLPAQSPEDNWKTCNRKILTFSHKRQPNLSLSHTHTLSFSYIQK